MKKFLCVVLVCILLAGCSYVKITTIQAKGKVIKVPIGSYAPLAGEDIELTITRQVQLLPGKVKLADFSDVRVATEKGNKGYMEIKR